MSQSREDQLRERLREQGIIDYDRMEAFANEAGVAYQTIDNFVYQRRRSRDATLLKIEAAIERWEAKAPSEPQPAESESQNADDDASLLRNRLQAVLPDEDARAVFADAADIEPEDLDKFLQGQQVDAIDEMVVNAIRNELPFFEGEEGAKELPLNEQLFQLLRHDEVREQVFAEMSGLSLSDVRRASNGNPVSDDIAEQVRRTLQQLAAEADFEQAVAERNVAEPEVGQPDPLVESSTTAESDELIPEEYPENEVGAEIQADEPEEVEIEDVAETSPSETEYSADIGETEAVMDAEDEDAEAVPEVEYQPEADDDSIETSSIIINLDPDADPVLDIMGQVCSAIARIDAEKASELKLKVWRDYNGQIRYRITVINE